MKRAGISHSVMFSPASKYNDLGNRSNVNVKDESKMDKLEKKTNMKLPIGKIMKKPVVLIMGSAVLLGVLLIGISVWYSSAREQILPFIPVRPADFPEILIAPENAVLIDHSTPSKGWTGRGRYFLKFAVEDPYPSAATRAFIEDHLRSNGWQLLRGDVLNPQLGPHLQRDLPEYIGAEALDALCKWIGHRTGHHYTMWFKQDWLNNHNEYIGVTYQCAYDLSTGKRDNNNVYVDMDFSNRESDMQPWIERYKAFCPEEFEREKVTQDANVP